MDPSRPSQPLALPMDEQSRLNLLLVSLAVLTVTAWAALPFMQVAPNRLVSGQAVYIGGILPGAL